MKSKICVVTTRNIFDSPCLDKYRQIIKEPFDIIYWDRCNIDENCGAENYYKFNGYIKPGASKFKKLFKYIGFTKFAKTILRKNDYEKLIVFPTQTAWLIEKELKGQYKKKYLLDIQDYAGENNKIINRKTKNAIKNSAICSITSPAYTKFLPNQDYVVSHNVQNIDTSLIESYRSRERSADKPIVLSFIGSVRFIDQQKRLINLFKNDKRFVLKFIGSGSEQLKSFVEEEKVENVILIGRFKREELGGFYVDTDMAINVYGNNDPYLDYALSNKLYSAALMGMPILVSTNTYMADIAEEFGIGFAVDLEEANITSKLYEYYTSLKVDDLLNGCDAFMKQVNNDEVNYREKIDKWIKS